jgi:hypothetical protein
MDRATAIRAFLTSSGPAHYPLDPVHWHRPIHSIEKVTLMQHKIEIDHDYELISFHVYLQEIKLRFRTMAVDMIDKIEIIRPDSQTDVIESVWDRKGNLSALWPLIGKHMKKLIMDHESCRILFEDGTIVRRKYEPGIELVNVWGPGKDEFTSYPNHIEPGRGSVDFEEVKRFIIRDPSNPRIRDE